MQSHVQALIWGVLELINCFNWWRMYFKLCEKPNGIFLYVCRGPATYVVCQRLRKGELVSIWRDSLFYVCILRLQIGRFILMFHHLRGGPLDQRSENTNERDNTTGIWVKYPLASHSSLISWAEVRGLICQQIRHMTLPSLDSWRRAG